MVMKFCWWTIFPTTYMKALLDGMRSVGQDVTVCYFGQYDPGRLAMGWKPRQLEPWEHQVRGISDARRQIPDFDERIQMVPSFFNLTSWKLILRCTLKGLPWFSITEGTRGRWMTRPLFKSFCWFVDRYALKLFVEGGARTRQQFVDAGVRPEKIVPFSYATMRPQERADVEQTTPDALRTARVSPERVSTDRRSPRRGRYEWCELRRRLNAGCAVPTEGAAVGSALRADRNETGVELSNVGTTFVYAGSFCERKAVDVIAAAWERLVSEFPASRLILAGGGEMGNVFDGLAGVEMVGAVRQEKVYEVICRGDVMLLPSRYDPWGVALVEGGMAGLAMVGSDRTGAADALVEDGVNGFVVKAGDEEDLLRVMRIYAADRAIARRHGEAARIAAERTSGESLACVVVNELGIR